MFDIRCGIINATQCVCVCGCVLACAHTSVSACICSGSAFELKFVHCLAACHANVERCLPQAKARQLTSLPSLSHTISLPPSPPFYPCKLPIKLRLSCAIAIVDSVECVQSVFVVPCGQGNFPIHFPQVLSTIVTCFSHFSRSGGNCCLLCSPHQFWQANCALHFVRNCTIFIQFA